MLLTTITPYWGRKQMLSIWLKALRKAAHPDVEHLVLFANEAVPENLSCPGVRFLQVRCPEFFSIGHLHNVGAQLANTDWIMKLDVDALVHAEFFHALLPHLRQLRWREWLNVGMFYMRPDASKLLQEGVPIGTYKNIVSLISHYSNSHYLLPAASNFVCRRVQYLELGGCLKEFKGWGWEDYQQLFMLEADRQQRNPLIGGEITLANVTNRCRDEISRPAAKKTFDLDNLLALLHYWHAPSSNCCYRSPKLSASNRQVLFDYISSYDRIRQIPCETQRARCP